MQTVDCAPSNGETESAELCVALDAVTGNGRVRRLPVEGGSCLIGRGDFCDLQVPGDDVPLAHSELHVERGAIWIEAVDEADLEINGRACRRLALREGDALRLGDTLITVRICAAADATAAMRMDEDLSQLSALELCERIEAEQAAVASDERRRLMGWDALLTQLEDIIAQEPAAAEEQAARLEGVLAQLHDLSNMLAARTQVLAAQEAQFLESAGELKHAQDAMTGRLEHLLQQFHDGELRASA
jgi:predicted component of type VI protein secretion system